MTDVLLVDDDGELLQSLARALSPRIAPFTLSGATTPPLAQELLERSHPRVVVLDLCLDEKVGVDSGFELLAQCRAFDSAMRIIVLTGHGSLTHGIRALTMGASSFIEKPVEPEHLAALIVDAIAQADLRREYEALVRQGNQSPLIELCGESAVMQSLRDKIAFVATTSQPVLLLGETGTGKGLCARLIHACSARRGKKFVHYQPNFGGGDLVQSELFGHLKGSFTGALEARQGLAVDAHGGTLFLDELDEVPAELQVRLLDLIQEQRVRAVGSDSFRKVECRFIAAMNRPLEEALSSGRLRRDLYHRLAYNVLYIPPLRERLDDIPEICDATLRMLRAKEIAQVFEVAPAALDRLRSYQWPGNVRELQAIIENSAHYAHYKGRSVISCEELQGFGAAQAPESSNSFHDQVERFKTQLIEQALQRCNGSQVQAARILGLDRGTLRRILTRSEVE